MRRIFAIALTTMAISALAAPAEAAQQVSGDQYFLSTFSGQDCPITGGGGGGFSNCYATTSGVVAGPTTDTTASQVVAKIDSTGTVTDVNPAYSVDQSNFDVSLDSDTNTLLFTYLTGSGPELTYLTIKQAGGGQSDGGYALFYDPAGFISGTQYTFDLSTYFPKTPGYSHIDVYDHMGAVPEPESWAMMLLGFGGIGAAMRRKRRARTLMQIA